MNLLAHLYLSDNSESVMIGNFIADFIRGNRFDHLPGGVIKGIKLHRAIDEFTDGHEEVKHCINMIRGDFGRYSGVVIDVFFDYFLIKDWQIYNSIGLKEFTQHVYQLLNQRFHLLPEPLQEILPTMIEEDWLVNYGNFEGLQRTFEGLTKRIDWKHDLSCAPQYLKKHEDMLKSSFDVFFPSLIEHVKNYRMILI